MVCWNFSCCLSKKWRCPGIERIRNTLSHEMCHLASWTINKNPNEGHGKIWKTWSILICCIRSPISESYSRAASVMKTRREIQITVGNCALSSEMFYSYIPQTKHNYEITYPYEWRKSALVLHPEFLLNRISGCEGCSKMLVMLECPSRA
jgi:hypothetical protein